VFKVRVKGEVDIFLPGGNGLCTVVWVAMICWCVFVYSYLPAVVEAWE